MAEEDPRRNPAPLADVPRLVAEGAARYNAGDFWHAHETWEQAWHSLRAAGMQDRADLVQALVWVTAAFENQRRGKPGGARRQLTKALPRLRAHAAHASALGVLALPEFTAQVEGALAEVPSAAAPRLLIAGA
ncbi:MAG: DUF309 domain-containing protein [Halobacteriales archaeon]|nr:DUF309 domain-containing protein [Halobacteriales archaeon]